MSFLISGLAKIADLNWDWLLRLLVGQVVCRVCCKLVLQLLKMQIPP